MSDSDHDKQHQLKKIHREILFVPQSLSFARAACAVRACAYKIKAGARPSEMKLPFCGPARLQQICDIATTGTTLELEQHRYCFHSLTHDTCTHPKGG